ncbi:MAG: DUF255 domain-containing protein [Bacteroidia bacterium]|nr:DUF255 domain-containing protein [Bacteroidia bacterium]
MRWRVALVGIMVWLSGCILQQTGHHGTSEEEDSNILAGESSPFLLSHAQDLIDWVPWDPSLLDTAARHHKLILLYSGYAAHYPCYQAAAIGMDARIAALINAWYIPVMIDQQLYPTLDAHLMEASQLMGNQPGGWPLVMLLLPDGRPLIGHTALPADQWVRLLTTWHQLYQEAPDQVSQIADNLESSLQEKRIPPEPFPYPAFQPGSLPLERLAQTVAGTVLSTEAPPREPATMPYEWLMARLSLRPDARRLEALSFALEQLGLSPMYDHLGGGFFDGLEGPDGRKPRFEKHLAHNARLISLYAHAYQLTHHPYFEKIVYESVGFIRRELTDSSGACHAARYAYSEGREGRYYVWSLFEVEGYLGGKASHFATVYNLSRAGNWVANQNILYRSLPDEELAVAYNLHPAEFRAELDLLHDQMQVARSRRIAPAYDGQMLTAPNALMVKAYLDAYRAFGDPDFLRSGLQMLEVALLRSQMPTGGLRRAWHPGAGMIPAGLEDYTYLIAACVAAYEVTFQEQWLHEADRLSQYVLAHFYDAGTGFCYDADDTQTPARFRRIRLPDDVLPNAQAVWAENLTLLDTYLGRPAYQEMARRMVRRVMPLTAQTPIAYTSWLQVASRMQADSWQVMIIGENCLSLRRIFDKIYLPYIAWLGGVQTGYLPLMQGRLTQGYTLIYLCHDGICEPPLLSAEAALDRIAVIRGF